MDECVLVNKKTDYEKKISNFIVWYIRICSYVDMEKGIPGYTIKGYYQWDTPDEDNTVYNGGTLAEVVVGAEAIQSPARSLPSLLEN